MTKALHGLRNASRTCVTTKATSSYVWISDDLLDDTFRAFSHGQRRHESNVPGPLEARRRAAKRKATHLARHKPVNRGLDSQPSLNPRAASRWWDEPEPEENASRKTSWFSFGLPFKPPPLPEPVTIIQHPSHDLEVLEKLQEHTKNNILKSLEHIRTCDELLHILEKHSVDLIHNPAFACDIFRHVLSCGWVSTEAEKFLLEPSLNPPGSACHLHIFQRGAARPSLIRDLITRRTVCQAIRLGLVELPTIKILPQAFLDCAQIVLLDSMDPHQYCFEVFMTVKESGLFQADQFDASGMKCVIESITSGKLCAYTPQLLWLLRTEISDQPTVLAQVIYDCLNMADSSTLRHIKHLVPFIIYKPQSVVNEAVVHLMMLLMNAADQQDWESIPGHPLFDYAGRREIIAKATGLESFHLPRSHRVKRMSTSIRDSPQGKENKRIPDPKPTVYELWYVILGAIGSFKSPRFYLSPETLLEFLKSGKTEEDAGKRNIAGLWAMMALTVNEGTSLRSINRRDVVNTIYNVFARCCDGRNQSLLGWLISNLRGSSLPAKNKLVHRLHLLSDGLITTKKTNYRDLNEQLVALEQLNLDVIADIRSYESVRRHFNTEVELLAQSMNSDLASFEETCIDLIGSVPGRVFLVPRLLKHNMELKNALRQASEYRTQGTFDWNPAMKEEASKEALGGYDYTQIVGMINNLSWAVATCENLSPRNRFRYSYWLTQYLHKHRAPVTHRTLNILWHTGVDAARTQSYVVVRLLYSYLVEYGGHKYAMERVSKSSKIAAMLQEARANHGSDFNFGLQERGFDTSIPKPDHRTSEPGAIQQMVAAHDSTQESDIVYKPFVGSPAPGEATMIEDGAWTEGEGSEDPIFDAFWSMK